MLTKGTKISCRIAPKHPTPVPAAIVRLRRCETTAEVLCCFRDCSFFSSHSSPSPWVAHLDAKKEALEHMVSTHGWTKDGWRLTIDTVKPDGHGGWTGLDRSIAAERRASDRRLYKEKKPA